MHENSGNSVIYYAHYTEDGVNKTGLTVTITVYEVIRDGTKTEVVTDGACTEIGDGLYRYLLASGTVDAAAEYVAVFHTATDTVDAQDIPAMWVIDRAGTEKLDTGVTLADDAITAAKFDESTAYPLKSADTGATQVARVGADGDTLETLSDEIAAVKAETASILEDTGTTIPATLVTIDDFIDTEVAAIKAKTDNLPASPAAVGSAMTLTAAYDKAKDDVLTPLGVVDGIVDAIKVQTDKIPASPASAGEYTANIGAIKAKTDNLPLSPASSGEYTSALTAIQNDLDNPNQYKADVSNLALQATSLAIKGQTDKIPAAPAQTGEYNAALTAIQADLDNPAQYKADVSGLATTAHVQEVENKIDAIDVTVNTIPINPLLDTAYTAPDNASIAAILEDTGTTIPATLTTIDNEIAVIDGNVDAILDDTGTSGVLLSTSALTSIFDDEVIVGSYNFSDLLKIMASALAGKLSGGGTTTLTFRGVDDTSDVIVTTVDANKNRTNVVITV